MTIVLICMTIIAVTLICASVAIKYIEKEKSEKSCPIYYEISNIQGTVGELKKVSNELKEIVYQGVHYE